MYTHMHWHAGPRMSALIAEAQAQLVEIARIGQTLAGSPRLNTPSLTLSSDETNACLLLAGSASIYMRPSAPGEIPGYLFPATNNDNNARCTQQQVAALSSKSLQRQHATAQLTRDEHARTQHTHIHTPSPPPPPCRTLCLTTIFACYRRQKCVL